MGLRTVVIAAGLTFGWLLMACAPGPQLEAKGGQANTASQASVGAAAVSAGLPAASAELKLVKFPVPTVTWTSCVPRVTASAKRAGGVEKVQVDLRSRVVTIAYDPARTNLEAIRQAIEDGGEAALPAPTE